MAENDKTELARELAKLDLNKKWVPRPNAANPYEYYGEQFVTICEAAKTILRLGGTGADVQEFIMKQDPSEDKSRRSYAYHMARKVACNYWEDPPLTNLANLHLNRPHTAQEIEIILERINDEYETPRDPLTQPPEYMHYILPDQAAPHPRADQYPSHYTFGQVLYAEDPFWTNRTVEIPKGTNVPEKPKDYWKKQKDTTPPEWVNEKYNPYENDVTAMAFRALGAMSSEDYQERARQSHVLSMYHKRAVWNGRRKDKFLEDPSLYPQLLR